MRVFIIDRNGSFVSSLTSTLEELDCEVEAYSKEGMTVEEAVKNCVNFNPSIVFCAVNWSEDHVSEGWGFPSKLKEVYSADYQVIFMSWVEKQHVPHYKRTAHEYDAEFIPKKQLINELPSLLSSRKTEEAIK